MGPELALIACGIVNRGTVNTGIGGNESGLGADWVLLSAAVPGEVFVEADAGVEVVVAGGAISGVGATSGLLDAPGLGTGGVITGLLSSAGVLSGPLNRAATANCSSPISTEASCNA